jgi:hypothetical protein
MPNWPTPGVGEDSPLDRVEAHVAGGRDERAAAEAFAGRYGDAVSVRWLGPRRVVEGLRPFGSWTTCGWWLRVFYALDPNGEEPGEARVAEESDERIVIALSSFEPARLITTRTGGFQPRQADVELCEPVGARVVIDASAGVARPSLADLRSRPDRRPRGRAHAVPVTLEISIDELELGVHASNLLKAYGVSTVFDLQWLSAEELAGLPNMNQKTFDEILDALAARGPTLR